MKLIAIVLALLLGVSADAWSQTRIAFVSGVEHYKKSGLNDLEYAEDDARQVQTALEDLGFKTFAVIGEDASLSNLNKELDRFIAATKALKKADIALAYFSGHGVQKLVRRTTADGRISEVEEPFFCPNDAIKSEVSTLLSLNILLKRLEASSGSDHNFILLDACRDSADKSGKGGIDGSTIRELSDKLALFFAAESGRRSYESKKLKHGIFTHYLLEGLRGQAADSDNEVTFQGLVSYVSKQVERNSPGLLDVSTAEAQRPNLMGNLSGTIVVGTLDHRSAPKIQSPQIQKDSDPSTTPKPEILKRKSRTRKPSPFNVLTPSETGYLASRLAAELTITVFQEPITHLLYELEEQALIPISIDEQSLDESGLNSSTPITMDDPSTNLHQAFEVLAGAGFGWYPERKGNSISIVICSQETQASKEIRANYSMETELLNETTRAEIAKEFSAYIGENSPPEEFDYEFRDGVVQIDANWSGHLRFLSIQEQFNTLLTREAKNAANQALAIWPSEGLSGKDKIDAILAKYLQRQPANFDLWLAKAVTSFQGQDFHVASMSASRAISLTKSTSIRAGLIMLRNYSMLQESILDRSQFDIQQDIELIDELVADAESAEAARFLASLNYLLVVTRDDTAKPSRLHWNEGISLRPGTKEFLESTELYLMGDYVQAEQKIRESQKKGMDRGFCLLVLTFIAKANGNQSLVNNCIDWIAREPTLKHCRPVLSQLMNDRKVETLESLSPIVDAMNSHGHGASGLISLGGSAETLLEPASLNKKVEYLLGGFSANDKSVFQRSLAGQVRKPSTISLGLRLILAENACVFRSIALE